MTDHSLPSVPLSDSCLAEAVALTSHAFHDTPSYREMVTDPERRRGFLAWLFERNVWLKLGSGTARCACTRGRPALVAVAAAAAARRRRRSGGSS